MKTLRYLGSIAFVAGLFVSIFFGIPWAVIVADDPPVPFWLRAAIFALLGGILIVLLTVGLEQRKKKVPVKSVKKAVSLTEAQRRIIIQNTGEVPGRKVSETIGLVQGHTVYAIWIGKDLSAIIRLILGGELKEYTQMMGKARSIATNRMIVRAEKMGADAVINVRYMTTSVIGSAAELLVYGTAVKLEDKI
jgi:uncharacterized protein YbjQ (UPF0145 family)